MSDRVTRSLMGVVAPKQRVTLTVDALVLGLRRFSLDDTDEVEIVET